MPQSFGLGRGLASLIPQKTKKIDETRSRVGEDNGENQRSVGVGKNQVIGVDIDKIVPNPYQPRLEFNEEKLEELVQSIKIHGIIQPLVVSEVGSRFELIAGERRLQAAKKAGLKKVPVITREAGEKEKLELAITENIQRHDLNPVEEAKAYKKLADEFQMNQDEIALKIGKSRSAIANKMRLLNLPIEIQRAIIQGKISEGHAKAILAMENQEKQRALFELILKSNLTVRQVEEKTREVSVKSHKRALSVDPEIKELENSLMGALGTKVKVTTHGKGGKIIIDYYSKEELDNILSKISGV